MTDSSPPPYALSLLGTIDLRGPDDSSGQLLVQSKVVALLAYLAIPSLGRYVRRDTLIGLLWPELDQTRARVALRKALHAIRSTLGPEALTTRGDEDVALAPRVVRCDAADLIEAADQGLLQRALELYRGELMPGFHLTGCVEFDQWLDVERAAVRERAAATTWAMARRMESDQQLSDAVGMARRAIQLSWSDERALRRALVMLERLGDHTGALRLYEDFARRMRAELDVGPSPETTEVAERIRGATLVR